MTNPQGYMFISYRSTKLPEVLRLRRKLEEFGIPVWHDKDSMPPGMLEQGMTDAIRNKDCAGAIVWLSRDMTDSTAIQRIEIPEILRRVQLHDEFVVIFCLDDGLTFEDAQEVLSSKYANFNLKSFLLQRLGNPIEEEKDLKPLASLISEKRIQLIHSHLAKDEPLKIHIAGHAAPPTTMKYALVIDDHPLFDERFTSEDNWQYKILPALDSIASSIVKYASGRTVIIDGTPQLSLALALGYALRTPRGIKANWLQVNQDSTSQQWSIESMSDPKHFLIEHSTDLLHGEDVAVLVGVTHDPKPTFDASADILPRFGAVIRVLPRDNRFPAMISSSFEASSLTQAIIKEIRSVVNEYRLQGSMHLFIAGPVGLAFLLGRQLNASGKIYSYEHVALGPIGIYRPNLVMHT